jgi:hypothetical protein
VNRNARRLAAAVAALLAAAASRHAMIGTLEQIAIALGITISFSLFWRRPPVAGRRRAVAEEWLARMEAAAGE